MCTVFNAVFLHHPLQYLATAFVVEVGVDIRQRDAVGVKETFEEEVILQRVNLGDAQTVGHHAAGCGTTPRTHPHAELLTCRVDKILNDEEVAGKAHRLHDMELEAYAVVDLVREGRAIDAFGTLVSQFGEVVGLELDAVNLFETAKFLYLLPSFFLLQRVLPILVACELPE